MNFKQRLKHTWHVLQYNGNNFIIGKGDLAINQKTGLKSLLLLNKKICIVGMGTINRGMQRVDCNGINNLMMCEGRITYSCPLIAHDI